MAIKWYKLGWSNEGIGWVKKNYFILKPTNLTIYWKLRLIGGKPGQQTIEREDNFTTEKDAFQAGNAALKAQKFAPKIG